MKKINVLFVISIVLASGCVKPDVQTIVLAGSTYQKIGTRIIGCRNSTLNIQSPCIDCDLMTFQTSSTFITKTIGGSQNGHGNYIITDDNHLVMAYSGSQQSTILAMVIAGPTAILTSPTDPNSQCTTIFTWIKK